MHPGSVDGPLHCPLAGVRVIEAASYISGPFATLTLADLGAEVTKVEPPGGEPMRRFGLRDKDVGLSFLSCNGNKRSVIADLKTQHGITIFNDLLDTADVLITNWRPAVAQRLGLTRDLVADRYPKLVWVRISGYG